MQAERQGARVDSLDVCGFSGVHEGGNHTLRGWKHDKPQSSSGFTDVGLRANTLIDRGAPFVCVTGDFATIGRRPRGIFAGFRRH